MDNFKKMNNKMGRPPMPKGTAKKIVFAVKLSGEDAKAIAGEIKKSGQTKSELIRAALLNNAVRMNTDSWWGAIPYTYEELHGKRVEWRMMVQWEDNKPPIGMGGEGRFFVRKGLKGYHVQIHVQYSQEREKIIDLSKEATERITRQPEGSKCEFSLFLIPP